MKLSDIRVCDGCHGALAPQGLFYVLRLSLAIVSNKALNQTIGLSMMLGDSLRIAEALSPEPEVIKIAGDEDKAAMTELLICQKCFLYGFDLAAAFQTRHETLEAGGS